MLSMTEASVSPRGPLSTPDPSNKSATMPVYYAKGLLNMPGQNNCFLNSAVQVLWHLDIFRRSFRELTGHACMADSCIFCALKELFNQFQYSQESALPPDALRFALAEAFSDQRRFQLGFMDDAAECFENILLRIHCHIANQDSEDMCSTTNCLPHCIPHQKFAMNLIEQIICHSCGATSDPFPFTQMVHYVSTPALCAQAKQYDYENGMTFGELLKSAGAVGDIRDCPRSCGARIQIKKSLMNKPDIVSIGLVWETERPTLSHIIDVFRAIGTTLRVPDVFDSVSECRPTVSTTLHLVGLVTYYGKHYSTFFFHTKLREWIYFDDAAVRAIGPHWQQVMDKCIRGHFQPLLLLYANPNGTSVNTDHAPKDITPLIVKKNVRRSYLSPLQAKCDTTSTGTAATAAVNNYHSLQNAQRNGMLSKNITSNSETNIHPIDKQNVSHIMRQISQNQINKPYAPQQPSEQTYSNLNTGFAKPTISAMKTRPNHINTHHISGAMSCSDVPDSPSGHSSVSYFSDIGEVDNRYISRKAVESILSLQRNSLKKNGSGSRNSSSSLESFDIRNGVLVFNKSLSVDKPNICSLQRHDSGNSSGDRNSASSASVSSVDSPFFTLNSKRRPVSNMPNQRHPPSPKLSSDGGYDSFSLSSSDSYPSVTSTISAAKMNRLRQIPEDVQLMEMINASAMLDCDKLCSAADVLLLKSHEKEREGDLRAAAALSDSAASKARSAMDAPYSNHQTLITAKMKHSMCVMRSASLHKRLNEMDAEEKRRIKEQMSLSTGAGNHSRQGSRDSTHGKHSRQNSKDGKDPKNKEIVAVKHQSLDCSKLVINKPIVDNSFNVGKTLELYATLPKKGSKKKIFQQGLSSLSSLRVKSDDTNLYRDLISKRDSISSAISDATQSSLKKKIDSNKKCVENNKIVTNSKVKTALKVQQTNGELLLKQSSRDSDFSDYYSEWEATRRTQQFVPRTVGSGSASCRENDSEFYGEIGTFSPQSTTKKQHKVRRKLLMGGFMKRKNRSLPDLREGTKSGSNECQSESQDILSELSEKESSTESKSIAQISAKGFHQPHRAFVSERGLYQRPSLLKVSPPLIEKPEQTYDMPCNGYIASKLSTNQTRNQFIASSPSTGPPTPPRAVTTTTTSAKLSSPVVTPTESTDKKLPENSFLKELESKRAEILRNGFRDKCNERSANLQSAKEPINQVIYQNCDSIVKPVLKNSLIKSNPNAESDNYESINLKSRSPPIPALPPMPCIAQPSHPSHPVPCNPFNNPISNGTAIANKTVSSQLTSPKIVDQSDQTDGSNPSNRSVKDLTSRFENIMKKETPLESEASVDANESKSGDKLGSLCSGAHRTDRTVAVMPNQTTNEETVCAKPMSQPVDANKADNYSVQSPTITQNPLTLNNCLTPSVPTVRPNRPPDYQTAMKRIGMLRNDKSLPAGRTFYMTASGNIIQSRTQCQQSIQIQSQVSEQQKSVTQKPMIATPEQPKQQLLANKLAHNHNTDEQNNSHNNSLNRKSKTFKKSVSFSDQVVLVACAEEEQEEHLPNPILERVLAKNNLSFAPKSP